LTILGADNADDRDVVVLLKYSFERKKIIYVLRLLIFE
jgi:hypothetical protein